MARHGPLRGPQDRKSSGGGTRAPKKKPINLDVPLNAKVAKPAKAKQTPRQAKLASRKSRTNASRVSRLAGKLAKASGLRASAAAKDRAKVRKNKSG